MKRLGVLFIIAGVACIFPFIRSLILENIVVMLGVYLIYRGYLALTSPECDKHKGNKKGNNIFEGEICSPNCKK